MSREAWPYNAKIVLLQCVPISDSIYPCISALTGRPKGRRKWQSCHFFLRKRASLLLGGNSGCDPPDPISNSEVKPTSADDSVAFAM